MIEKKEKTLKMMEFFKQTKQFVDENQEVLDRLDDWESILGMTIDEMEAYEVGEIVEMVREKLGLEKKPLTIPPTKFPREFIFPKDKVTNKFFENSIPVGKEQPIGTEGTGKKQLTAIVSIKYDHLENVRISREITPYDREVHDAVCSLYLNANNYVTPLMVYRTMTGNPRAKLNLGSKQHEAINESIDKLSFTKITINAEKEKEDSKGWKMDKTLYQGNLLYTERVTGYQKGTISEEWIHVLREPVLYEYAQTKNQIDRVNISLLNPPNINKNEETIILQGYLLRRVRAMKSNSNLKKKILYETIYKQLDIKMQSESNSSALRNKQKKIRDSVKKILDYWIEQKEIRGYKEEFGANKTIVGITIQLLNQGEKVVTPRGKSGDTKGKN